MRTVPLIALCIAARLGACECFIPTICERLDNASVVFLGEVVEGGGAPDKDAWSGVGGKARLKVLEAFRGIPKDKKEVEIELLFIPGMCSPSPYQRGKRVLVFLDPDDVDESLKDGPCPQSIGSEYVDRELGTVRKYFRGEMKTQIFGTVMPNQRTEVARYLGTGSLAGATVIAERDGRKFRAVSGPEGNYSMNLPGGGTYRMRAELAGYDFRDEEQTVDVKQNSCAVQNFGLWTANSIEGHVFDSNGNPVRGVAVHLRRTGGDDTFGSFATTDVQGAFRFSTIHAREYTVAVSPDGETADSPYKPHRTAPFTVDSKSAITGLTLTLPPPIATRTIRIRVTGVEDRQLPRGVITCAQTEKPETVKPVATGVVTCRALSDRHYRISLTTFGIGNSVKDGPEVLVLPGPDDVEVRLQAP